jgi:nucleoside-diphosphate-sugar epimerase
VINIGSADEIETRKLADVIINTIDPDCDVMYQSLPTDDTQARRSDITQAEERLDCTPTIWLSAGIENTITYPETELRITTG